ncbi:MAG: GNAT family N-acetyltransferase [Clostridia bacterium]|nr:GNAT family N-acetyltransferase [Clostridia bacterium]
MKSEIIIVKNQSELDDCIKIRREVFVREQNIPADIETDGYDILNGECVHFLILCEGVPSGTFRCRHEGGKSLKLQRFCLLPQFRCKGLGKFALEYLENYCREFSFEEIVLDSQYPVIGFYEKCGFVTFSDVFEEAGILHVKMKRII